MTQTIKYFAAATFVFVLFAFNQSNAQNFETQAKAQYEYALENLEQGIRSDNYGLRRSAIYLAGKYQIEAAAETLLAQLDDEEYPENRILIGLSLYEIGNTEAVAELKGKISKEEHLRVKEMFTAICSAFELAKGESLVLSK